MTQPLEILRVSHEVEVEQNASLTARRAARDHAAVEAALADMIKVARADGNMIEPMLTAARAEATLGRNLQRTTCRVGRVRRASALLSSPDPTRLATSQRFD